MTTFRKTLMATTVLAGFAIFVLDAAQAGPNGGPSLGSISGFSSMRMDFNRIGGPSRALSRDDTRIVPLDAKKTGKPKDTKNLVKKGTDVARVLNPKSSNGGKGKEDASAVTLHVPAALAEIYRITGGNLDDISKFAELAGWLKTGPLAAGSPLFPGNEQGDVTFVTPKGDGTSVWPEGFGQGGQQPSGGDKSESRYWGLNGWSGYSRTPGGPDTSKTGWAGIWTEVQGSRQEGDGYRRVSYYDAATDRYGTVTHTWGDGDSSREITVGGVEDPTANEWTVRTTHHDANGSHTRRTDTTDVVYGHRLNQMTVFTSTTITTSGEGPTSQPGNEEPYYQEPGPKDSQPVAEGTGRPGRDGWCSPTGGCVTTSVVQGPRIIPASDAETPEMRSQLPSWATDPCPDCTSRGGGGGYSGFDPHDEGDGAPDRPGRSM